MDINFLVGILIGLIVGGGGVWFFKVRKLQQELNTMIGKFRTADEGRRGLEAKSRHR